MKSRHADAERLRPATLGPSIAIGCRLNRRRAPPPSLYCYPDGVGLGGLLCRLHERLRARPLPAAILRHRAARGDRAVFGEHGLPIAVLAAWSRCLMSSQLMCLPLALSLMRTSTQPPCRRSPSSTNLKSPLAKASSGVRPPSRFPVSAVPQLHGAAAVFALRNRPLEVAVVERMVFDLDRQALVGRIERGPARHRPGLEHAVEFQPQVVVQPASRHASE